MSDEILMEVGTSAVRRVIGVAMLTGLGVLMVYIAFATQTSVLWRIFLIVFGVAILWLSQRMWFATALRLQLTEHDLRDSDGTVLVRIEDVVKVERGNFSIKPSNGFMIKANSPQKLSWQPGLWWRMGRMVAIGGVTPGSQTKPMADIIAAMVADRKTD